MSSALPPNTVNSTDSAQRGWSLWPSWAVARELADSLLDGVRLLWRFPLGAMRTGQRRTQLLEDLQAPAPNLPGLAKLPWKWPQESLHIFLSWAEPSGELHALGLARQLREQAHTAGAPAPRFSCLGSSAGEANDMFVLGRPAERATMGFVNVLGALPYYLGLCRDAARFFREQRPDVFVPVDSPGLHVPLGRMARHYGVPVCHFITPQFWAWAPWRAGRYRQSVDRALSILPFEPRWFEREGIAVTHVGHPIVDALKRVTAPSGDTTAEPKGQSSLLALLPGSRRSVLKRNLPWMLQRVLELKQDFPELEVAVCLASETLLEAATEHWRAAGSPAWVRLDVDQLHNNLARARAAFSVSGTVLLDVLHHHLPTLVIYRLDSKLEANLGPHLLASPWFASINLLAGREVVPEYYFEGEGPVEEVAQTLKQCFSDSTWRQQCEDGLRFATNRLGPAGALERSASAILETVASPPS